MARIGKIARLPQELREQLNHRLANGEPGGSLLRWLNELPEAREVLAALFDGAVITKQNLSEWRKGGFREWQTRQDLFSDARKLSARAQEIRDVAGDKLTDDLATVLAGQYAMVLRRWLGQETPELLAQLKVLHGLCGDIAALRRGDHAVAQFEFNLERWDFDREIKLRQLAALERKQAEGPGESKLVQVKNFHRGEPCRLGHETRRKREMGEEATERAEMSCGSRRADSQLGDLAALRDESEFFDASQAESNLVQPKICSGALRSGVQTTVETGEHSRSAELLPNIYMRGGRAEDLKNSVRYNGPTFAAHPCRTPGSAPVSDASVGVPPTLPLPFCFPLSVPQGGRRDAVLGDRDGRAPRLRPHHESAAGPDPGGSHACAPGRAPAAALVP